MDLLSRIAGNADSDKVFFVISHRILVYEKELVRMSGNRFDIFTLVPTHLTSEEVSRLKKCGVAFAFPSNHRDGSLKSFSFEIFKHRPSVVMALDGNSADTNVIQEAKNGKRKARIFFINCHATSLYSKAKTFRGYTAVIENADVIWHILEAVRSVWNEMLWQT